MSGILIWNVLGVLTPVALITLIAALWRRSARAGTARPEADSVQGGEPSIPEGSGTTP